MNLDNKITSHTPTSHTPMIRQYLALKAQHLYGQLGDNGVAPTDLDACGGHTDKTYPFYHYHLPKAQAFPYLVACLKGCIFSNQINGLTAVTVATCDKATTQYDYSTLKVVAASSGTSPAPTPTPSSGSNSRNVQGYLILSIIFSLLILFFISEAKKVIAGYEKLVV